MLYAFIIIKGCLSEIPASHMLFFLPFQKKKRGEL